MSRGGTYRIYIQNRTAQEVQRMIKSNPDVLLDEKYTTDGFVTNDIDAARSLKRTLQQCLDYAFQTERVARRNARGRHQTAGLSAEWGDVRVIIEPDPDAARLLR